MKYCERVESFNYNDLDITFIDSHLASKNWVEEAKVRNREKVLPKNCTALYTRQIWSEGHTDMLVQAKEGQFKGFYWYKRILYEDSTKNIEEIKPVW